MATLSAIRNERRSLRLAELNQGVRVVLEGHPLGEVWLFGSLARGDWDAFSDVDLLAVSASSADARDLADALQSAGLGDDVLALSTDDWQRLRSGDDPYWRVIGSEALRLDTP